MKIQLLALITAFGILSVPTTVTASTSEDITISPGQQKKAKKQTIIEEYHEGGIHYIKVTPSKGPVYYLIDSDGDGDMDTRRNELAPNLLIPSWTIFSW